MLAYRVDELPEGLRAPLQGWLRGNNAHERAAPTSKLLAYHLEIWFSSSRWGFRIPGLRYLGSRFWQTVAYCRLPPVALSARCCSGQTLKLS